MPIKLIKNFVIHNAPISAFNKKFRPDGARYDIYDYDPTINGSVNRLHKKIKGDYDFIKDIINTNLLTKCNILLFNCNNHKETKQSLMWYNDLWNVIFSVAFTLTHNGSLGKILNYQPIETIYDDTDNVIHLFPTTVMSIEELRTGLQNNENIQAIFFNEKGYDLSGIATFSYKLGYCEGTYGDQMYCYYYKIKINNIDRPIYWLSKVRISEREVNGFNINIIREIRDFYKNTNTKNDLETLVMLEQIVSLPLEEAIKLFEMEKVL